MATTTKIVIGIDDQVIELKGADKEAFIADREETNAQIALLEAEYKAKQDSRESAIKKLAEIAGLTKEELDAIL
jgi:outer membrane protein TolC